MSLQPLWSPWLIAAFAIPLGALAIWELTRSGSNRIGWIRRLALIALMALIGLGPSIEERVPDALLSNAEVYFVVDRTGSMAAQDYGPDNEPRLVGVSADIQRLTRSIPAAQYSILAFDSQASSQLPLTSDARAVRAWASTIRQEVTNYSAGSAIDRPLDMLEKTLTAAQERNPQNVRLVFLFSDGENTRGSGSNPDAIRSFAPLVDLVDGGAVLGYGTTEGGQMLRYTGVGEPEEGDWIIDASTQQPAVSRLDEQQLRTVAADLNIPYLHRFDASSLASVVNNVAIEDASHDGRRDAVVYRGIFWILALGAGVLLAWEGWDLLRQVPSRKGTERGDPDPLAPTRTDNAPEASAAVDTPADLSDPYREVTP